MPKEKTKYKISVLERGKDKKFKKKKTLYVNRLTGLDLRPRKNKHYIVSKVLM